jgi:RHS repeat-associated protein
MNYQTMSRACWIVTVVTTIGGFIAGNLNGQNPTAAANSQETQRHFLPERSGFRSLAGRPPEPDVQQELKSILDSKNAAAVMISPGPERGAELRSIEFDTRNRLEAFVNKHPNSAWTPSVHLSLARVSQTRCAYGNSIEHYREVWKLLKASTNSEDRMLAEPAVGGLAKLLAFTGQLEELNALESEVKKLEPSMRLNNDWKWAMEIRAFSLKHPTDSFKCGLHCLDVLGRLTQLGEFKPRDIVETDSSFNGFTAEELVRIASKAGVRVHAAFMSDKSNPPVPSIVHLQSDHFVVIRSRRGAFYDVFDPTAYGPRWLTGVEIGQEASGCVLISDVVSNLVALKILSNTEARMYRGRCHGSLPFDHDDSPDPHDCNGCATCNQPGMPNWFVSQPFLALWMQDTPLEYKPAIGPPVTVRLAYNDRRETSVVSSGADLDDGKGTYWYGGSFGNTSDGLGFWSSSLFSFGELDLTEDTADMMLPGGGWATFIFQSNSSISDINYRHAFTLEKVGSPGEITSLILHKPDGSYDTYGVHAARTNTATSIASDVYFITASADPAGNSTTFSYDDNLLLTNVTAADGTTFLLQYRHVSYAPGADYVTNVTTSYGASASFTYDYTSEPNTYASMITSITDPVGLTSEIHYENNSAGGMVTELITPYGKTLFTTLGNSNNVNPEGIFDRTVRVTLPNGTQEFYAQMNTYSNGDWPDFATNQIPLYTPINTLDTDGRQERNTFYWNPQQFGPYINTPLTNFNWDIFKQSRINHWLAATGPIFTHYDTLSIEQEPSPDGSTEGQLIWYDYAGKPPGANYERGAQIQPSVIAKVMPDGSTVYKSFQLNSNGLPIIKLDWWTDGMVQSFVRSNVEVYAANNIDLIAETNALGIQVVSNMYNANHQVVTNYDALNQMTVFQYDGATLLLTNISRPSGWSTAYIYSGNRLQQTIDQPIGATRSYTWDAAGNIRTVTDERGLTVTNFWDGLHRLTGTAYPDGTSTTNLYYRLDNTTYPNSTGGTNILDLTAVRDRMGFWSYFDYDSLRRIVGTTNANGLITRFGYCDCGTLTYVTNAYGSPLQSVVQYAYDYQTHRIQSFFPDGTTINNTYDALGRMVTTTDGVNMITNIFDNLGRVTAVYNPVGRVQANTYDDLDRITSRVDANNVTINIEFDVLNRVQKRIYPDGGVESFGYTFDVTRPTRYTNQLNEACLYAYDSRGRELFETNANSEITRFTYDDAGDLLTLTDGRNQVTSWNYDVFGRATNKTDTTSATVFGYSYDSNNRLTNRWTPEKGTTVYCYDSVGNLTNIVYLNSPSISMAYDVLNRLTNMVDAIGATTYTYDSVGQLTSEDGPWAEDTVSYTYTNGLRKRMVILQPSVDAWTNAYSYDYAERLANLTSPAGSFSYSYVAGDAASMLPGMLRLPNGAYIANIYDSLGGLTGTYLRNSSGASLSAHEYSYDLAGQRTQQSFRAGNFTQYSYDKIGQLTAAKGYEADGVVKRLQEQFGYSYDHAGNLNMRTNNALVQVFGVDNLNRLTNITRFGSLTVGGATTYRATNVTVNGLPAERYLDASFALEGLALGDGNNTFTAIGWSLLGVTDSNTITADLPITNKFVYDTNGNLRTNGTRVFDFNDENKLIRITEPGAWKTEFGYDGRMRRRSEKNFTWQSGMWLQTNELNFIYDGSVVVQERDTNNSPVMTLTRGLDLSRMLQGAGGVGGLLAMTEASGVSSFYHSDGSGNVATLLDTNQIIVANYRYDPFGRLLSLSGPRASINRYRYAGKPVHVASQLYDFGYRWYSAEISRFLNRDPAGELNGLNLFSYCENSPINSFDPFGLCKVEVRYAKIGLFWYHAYVVVTDTDGSQTYYRGGPSSNAFPGASLLGSGGSASQRSGSNANGSNSSNSSSPGSGAARVGGRTGPWGPIQGDSGPYVPGTVDWDPNPSPTVVVLDDNEPCKCKDKLQAALDRIGNANIPYNPFGDNSNATAHEIIQDAGFPRPTPPPGVWAPGNGNRLSPVETPPQAPGFNSGVININTPSIYLTI